MGWIDREENWLERPPARARPDPEPPAAAPADSPETQEPVVRWVPVRCPYCRSRDVPVSSSPRGFPGMRYHKCRDCGGTFKSFEVDLVRKP